MVDRNQEWLDSLKAGDEVALRISYFPGFNYNIKQVTKVTPTRIIKVGGYEFDSKGRERGRKSSWGRGASIEPVTGEVLGIIEKKELLTQINSTKFETLPLEALRTISKAIKGI
jgi:hypothetical protein